MLLKTELESHPDPNDLKRTALLFPARPMGTKLKETFLENPNPPIFRELKGSAHQNDGKRSDKLINIAPIELP